MSASEECDATALCIKPSSMPSATALSVRGWQSRLNELWETKEAKKARRIAFHVVRAAKKFVIGSGNAAWVMGTTVLVLVMPLVFEIDREQQALEMEAGGVYAAPK